MTDNEVCVSDREQIQLLQNIHNDMPCGSIWYKLGLNSKIVFVNNKSLKLLGYSSLSEMEKYGKTALMDFVHPDDVERIRQEHNAFRVENKKLEMKLKIVNKVGNIYNIVGTAKLAKYADGCLLMQLLYTDITELSQAKSKIEEQEKIIMGASENSELVTWTYNIQEKKVISDYGEDPLLGYALPMDNVPDSFFSSGMVYPDDEPSVRAMFADILKGKHTAQSTARWLNKKTGGYAWCKVVYKTIFDEQGNPIKAMGTATEVGEERYLDARYNEEMGLLDIVSKNTLYNLRINLLTGEIEELRGLCSFNISLGRAGSLQDFFSNILDSITTDEDRAQAAKILNVPYFMHRYEKGLSAFSVEYVRKFDDGNERAVHVEIRLRQNPLTHALTAFLYGTDVSSEKLTHELIAKITQMDYEVLGLIDVATHKVSSCYSNGLSDIGGIGNNEDYSVITPAILQKIVLEKERADAMKRMSLDTIKKVLEVKSTHRCIYPVLNKEGKIVWKKWAFSYLSDKKNMLVFCRRDISYVMDGFQQKNKELANALLAAQQASKAKTDFLSRMSHEIRTPMNVIIGMSTIAAKSIGKDEETADCIGKIGISARFLLSLINDILDMSKIESGKMFLRNEDIPFAEFLKGLNYICYSQAEQSNVCYECIVDHMMDDYYVGDAGKLQQVLINIISNAIKFTQEGGKVTFSVQQVQRTAKNATIKFVVNDTGCGISEKFLEHIFEPFAQEDGGTTSKYNGTGLGLAISKNIVDMMGGKITIRSIKHIGSEFTITVRLDVSSKSAPKEDTDILHRLVNLRSLVVDDDVNVCEQATATLHDMGLQAEWVDSGRKAIDRVKEKWTKSSYYDIILVDWKMPDMDGIETTKEIRKIVGPDVTIIIMTAYEWANIERTAKNVGVNLLMDKPLFRSSLVSAFTKAFHSKQSGTCAISEEQFNFTGKRLLVVEDHLINAEVAKKLLVSKGFAVDCANNGLKALEIFTTMPARYYDAILMDIRMPLMDGIQATQAIRRLTKEDAKRIPIIAMTANAFEEDIENTKRVGMNAHLAKPIEPRLLYQTLYHFIYSKKD